MAKTDNDYVEKPVTVVEVPRAAFTADVWERPFSELRAMAERGECGMRTYAVSSLVRVKRKDDPPEGSLCWTRKSGADNAFVEYVYIEPGVALMRQGSDIFGGSKDKSFLYGQSW